MYKIKLLLKECSTSGILTLFLTSLLLLFVWEDTSSFHLLTSLPFFVILYFLFFSIGGTNTTKWFREKFRDDIKRIIIFPTFLIVVYYSYIVINGGNPLKGTVFLYISIL